MAILKCTSKDEKLYLRPNHIFGRNSIKSDTVLYDKEASQIHASVRWNGYGWEIIDHSRNGIIVDDRRLETNIKTTLVCGQKIQFSPEPSSTWIVECLDPPSAMLIPQYEVGAHIILNDIHQLPSEASPKAFIYLSHIGQWMWEYIDNIDGNTTHLQDGDFIHIDKQLWQFVEATTIEATVKSDEILGRKNKNPLFCFTVSQDEEHVSLCISNCENMISLGERIHHYSLLILARQRREDARQGLDASSQGWLDTSQLAKMLGLDVAHLNIQIFRSRQQITGTLSDKHISTNYLERRRGQIRFGAFRFQIIRGTTNEGIFCPFAQFN